MKRVIELVFNTDAGCNNGEHHIAKTASGTYHVCRCGNGCNGTHRLSADGLWVDTEEEEE